MSPQPAPRIDPLLTPGEVAERFRVSPRTVGRWAKEGKLKPVRTLGGHRRYREADIRALLTPALTATWNDAVRSLTDEQGR